MSIVWVSDCPVSPYNLTELIGKEPDCMSAPPLDPWQLYPLDHHVTFAHTHPFASTANSHPHSRSRATDTPSYIQYGDTPTSLVQSIPALSYGYEVEHLWNWTLQAVMLTALRSGAQYYYRVGNDADGWSDVLHFTTLAQQSVMNIAFFGDMGTPVSGTGFITASRLVSDEPVDKFDLVILAGDIAYGYFMEPLWDWWFRHIAPLASYVPWMVAPGNQDADYSFAGYQHRFRMPAVESRSNTSFYYSFDFGLIHFVAMSTEHPYDVGSVQYEWLQQDLQAANANRARVPWLMFYGHRPMYCSNLVWCPDAGNLRNSIEPLLLQNNVDLALWGHVHMYERTWPIAHNQTVQTNYINPKAPVHITAGTGGALLCAYLAEQPDWSALRSLQFGYGRFQTFNDTHVHWEFVEQLSGEVFDDFWLVNENH
eukprot:TRINITY_DN14081_c0_g1_i1.p1 TRINITY_DN14081_c0_g1~~TRINITY_DN14081_c0_g1_i1.p1  ORF type:complete len:477 (-),score=88.35 TRINITY_DN14081_c0_g1_i1:13-1287(-)